VNVSQDKALIYQSLDNVAPQALAQRLEQLAQAPKIAEAFGPVCPQSLGTTATVLTEARQNLKPVSQHQILNLDETGGLDKAVVESGRTLKLRTDGSVFAPERLNPHATLEIVGHGSPDGKEIGGKTPQQLAQLLKDSGITQLHTLHLKSCYSEQFKSELGVALEQVGVRVNYIQGFTGRIAIEMATGKTLTEQNGLLTQSPEHSGELGRNFNNLVAYGKVYPGVGALDQGGQLQLGPDFKVGEAGIIPFMSSGTDLDPQILTTVKDSVGRAVDQAFDEFFKGQIVNRLADHFNQIHQIMGNDCPLHNPLNRINGLFEYIGEGGAEEGYGLLPTKLGYLIEERVTQLLFAQKQAETPPLDSLDINFQVPIGTSIPDIVLTDPNHPSMSVRVDITAAASVGHILDKDSKAWFGPGIHSYEVLYPSIPNKTVLGIFNGIEPPPLDKLKQAEVAKIAAKEQNRADILSKLQPIQDFLQQNKNKLVQFVLNSESNSSTEANLKRLRPDQLNGRVLPLLTNGQLGPSHLDHFMRVMGLGATSAVASKSIDKQKVFEALLVVLRFDAGENNVGGTVNFTFENGQQIDDFYNSAKNVASKLYNSWPSDYDVAFDSAFGNLKASFVIVPSDDIWDGLSDIPSTSNAYFPSQSIFDLESRGGDPLSDDHQYQQELMVQSPSNLYMGGGIYQSGEPWEELTEWGNDTSMQQPMETTIWNSGQGGQSSGSSMHMGTSIPYPTPFPAESDPWGEASGDGGALRGNGHTSMGWGPSSSFGEQLPSPKIPDFLIDDEL
jgi:hypothetical protein